jgi:hypothetical protein
MVGEGRSGQLQTLCLGGGDGGSSVFGFEFTMTDTKFRENFKSSQ